jgi:DnaJ-class molecular chaperone
MTTEKCQRCGGKGKRGLFGQKCAWCEGTGSFQPGPCPNCKGKGKVRASMSSIDNEPGGFSFGAKKQVVGLDGMTQCTKCDGTGTSINRPHNAFGDK